MFLPSNITLKLGDSGDFVAELQRRLAARDLLSSDMVTSFYDGATVSAVRQFQNANGLRADGVAGPETLRRLNGLSDATATSGSSSSNQSDNEQESGIAPVNQRILQLQREEDLHREQIRVQHEMEQQAALQQQQQLDPNAQALQQQRAELLTETKKQLPGVEAGRDQHVSRAMERNEAMNLAMQQQAFIDRPISQTFMPTPDQKPDQKLEQDVGTHNRGPNLGLNPERALEQRTPERSPDQPGLSRPREGLELSREGREPGKDIAREAKLSPGLPAVGEQRGNEISPGQNLERAALRINSPTQGSAPDFDRIRSQMESRLPPHVIQEVRQVGVVMLNNGVQGGQSMNAPGSPGQTPGMEQRQAAVGGGRGA